MSDLWKVVHIHPERHLTLLERFYETQMRPNFPVVGQLEPLERWIASLQRALHHTDNAAAICELHVDVAIDPSSVIHHKNGHKNDKEMNEFDEQRSAQIVGGIVWEYYKPSNTVLISYLVTDESTRGQGAALFLALSAWSVMQEAAQALGRKHPDAILCEVNDPMRISDSDDSHSPIERIRAFQKMGVRHLKDCFYVQPALDNNGGGSKSHDLLLGIIVAPMTKRDENGKLYVPASIIRGFITDSYLEYGADISKDPDYKRCMDSMEGKDKLYLDDFDLSRFKKSERRKREAKANLRQRTSKSIPVKVAVLGAGLAGLAAARDLSNHGFDVVIFEARHRIGGRIYTSRSWETRVDHGATWLHGTESNPLAEYAETSLPNLKTYHSDEQSLVLYGDDGIIDQSDIVEGFMTYQQIIANITELMTSRYGDNRCPETLHNAVEEVFRLSPELRHKTKAQRFVFNYMLSQLESLEASDAKLLNARDHSVSLDYDGGDQAVIGGFNQFIVSLANGLDIRTDHIVTALEYDVQPNGKVLVHLQDKDIFEADVALVTFPIGIMQSSTVTYIPPLPLKKRESLERIGCGLFNKVIMRFQHVFWDPVDYIGFNLDLEQPESLSAFSPTSSPHLSRKNIWFYNYFPVSEQPILIAMLSASLARQCEPLSDSEVLSLVLARLQRMYGSATTTPLDVQVTRWGQEKFSRCSYTYMKAGCSLDDMAEAGAPLGQRVYFAGEHTSIKRFGYADGAFESGIREASRIYSDYAHLENDATSIRRSKL